MKKGTVYAAAVISMIFWGFSFVWVKIMFKYYTPFTLVFLRLLLATAIMGTWRIISRPSRINPADIRYFLVLALFEPFFYFIGESFGMQLVTPTVASIVIALIPVIAPFFTFVFLREKLSFWGFIGLVASTVGVLLLVLNRDLSFNSSPKGLLLLLFAVMAAIGYGIVAKRLTIKYTPVDIITMQNFFGMLYFVPLFFIFDFRHFITVRLNFELVSTLLLLTVFASTLAFILFTRVMRDLGINNANIFTNLIPMFTALFSFLVYHESFTPRKIAGILVVIAGVFVSQLGFYIRKGKSAKAEV